MIGILGAELSGGRISSEIVPLVSQVDQVKGVGLLVLAIDPQLCAKSDGPDFCYAAGDRGREGQTGTSRPWLQRP